MTKMDIQITQRFSEGKAKLTYICQVELSDWNWNENLKQKIFWSISQHLDTLKIKEKGIASQLQQPWFDPEIGLLPAWISSLLLILHGFLSFWLVWLPWLRSCVNGAGDEQETHLSRVLLQCSWDRSTMTLTRINRHWYRIKQFI